MGEAGEGRGAEDSKKPCLVGAPKEKVTEAHNGRWLSTPKSAGSGSAPSTALCMCRAQGGQSLWGRIQPVVLNVYMYFFGL